MTRAAVFLDRDGTLLDELGYLGDPDELVLLPGAAEGVRTLGAAGWAVVVLTNQSGIARGLFTEADLGAVHARMERELARAGARVDGILHCPHHPEHGPPELRRACACRKPSPGLFTEAARRWSLDLARSWSVGDSARDLEAGDRAGVAGGILVLTGKGRATLAELGPGERARWRTAHDLVDVARLLGAAPR